MSPVSPEPPCALLAEFSIPSPSNFKSLPNPIVVLQELSAATTAIAAMRSSDFMCRESVTRAPENAIPKFALDYGEVQ